MQLDLQGHNRKRTVSFPLLTLLTTTIVLSRSREFRFNYKAAINTELFFWQEEKIKAGEM